MSGRGDLDDLEIRAATEAEFATAIDWAAAEGWNPGLDDLPAFFAADPGGFLMGFRKGEAVTSISVVRYGDGYGFLGFYICHPEHRGLGAGLATWKAGMAHLGDRTIGLDGVLAQQENYRTSGFEFSERNLRFSGVPSLPAVPSGVEVRAINGEMQAALAYDRSHVAADRTGFAEIWLGGTATRFARIAVAEGEIAGLGVIRACREGAKIGPLFANGRDVAEALVVALAGDLPEGTDIVLDVPEPNRQGVALAQELGLEPAFETARMYRGPAPDLPLARIFGVTTFELG